MGYPSVVISWLWSGTLFSTTLCAIMWRWSSANNMLRGNANGELSRYRLLLCGGCSTADRARSEAARRQDVLDQLRCARDACLVASMWHRCCRGADLLRLTWGYAYAEGSDMHATD